MSTPGVVNTSRHPQDDPPSELTANGKRYLIGIAGDDTDGWDWTVEDLPITYDGCDGLCTYGCGADPWRIRSGGTGVPDYADALTEAAEMRARIITLDNQHRPV